MAFQIKKFNSIVASMINWVSGTTTKVTDFNIGSVVRTLLEAVAIELEELYYQLLQAVEEAIEEAIYRAFNFPRNPAERATGMVTFYRTMGSDAIIVIPRGSLVSTSSEPSIQFETQSEERLPAISGSARGGNATSLIADRDFASDLGLDPAYVSFPATKIINLSKGGEADTLLSISTTNTPNDTLNFTTLSGGASFAVDLTVIYDDNGVVIPQTSPILVNLVTGEDYLYFGSSSQFSGFNVALGTVVTIQNVVGALIGEYWNGLIWVPLPYFSDETKGTNSKPFSVDGLISWEIANNWAKTVYGTYNLYWVRIKSDTTLTSASEVETAQLIGDAYKVIIMEKDIDVQAVLPGISGNVSAHTINQMRSSLPNIFAVDNLSSFSDGEEEETDLARKGRFALYIQSLARATRGALEYAAHTVEQIVAAKAIDDVRATVLKSKWTGLINLWTDITEPMRNPGDIPVKLFEDSEGANDALYFGAKELFNYINMHLVIDGVVLANNTVWEYRGINSITGDFEWKTLSVVDGTDPGSGPLQQSGTISFTPPTDWVSDSFPPLAVGYSFQRLWVRLRITIPGVTFSTTPTGDWCSLPPGFGYVLLYCHDGSGELNENLKVSVENAVEAYRGCGIIVDVTPPYKIQPVITCSLLIATNYDAVDIGTKVRQALIDYLNAKVLGEDLYVAELYQFIMDKYDKAILNTSITAPTQDIIVPNSGVIRADPTAITVTAITV